MGLIFKTGDNTVPAAIFFSFLCYSFKVSVCTLISNFVNVFFVCLNILHSCVLYNLYYSVFSLFLIFFLVCDAQFWPLLSISNTVNS